MSAPAEDFVRSLLLPTAAGGLLVPSAVVAEVIGEGEPEPAPGAPTWVRGLLPWRGTRLPVIAPEVALGGVRPPAATRGRVVVLHALGESAPWPFYGVSTRGIPQVVLASPRSLAAGPDPSPATPFVRVQLVLESGGTAMVPDLDALESALAAGLAGAPAPPAD